MVALYCVRFKSSSFENYFLQPLPAIRSENYQDFVPMTKKESVKIDDLCRNGPIPIEQLRSHMIDFVKLNNRRLLRLRRMMPNIDGQPIHYVVSFDRSPVFDVFNHIGMVEKLLFQVKWGKDNC